MEWRYDTQKVMPWGTYDGDAGEIRTGCVSGSEGGEADEKTG